MSLEKLVMVWDSSLVEQPKTKKSTINLKIEEIIKDIINLIFS